MSPHEIEVGRTYHNGKEGPRSYSARKVIAVGVKTTDWDGTEYSDGVRYEQVAGKYKGDKSVLRMGSFAKWAKGEVEA